MRRLVVDGHDLDIDSKTAIGIDIQCTDLKEPGERKLKTSNSFTVPVTMQNKITLGIVGGVQSSMDRIYSPFSFSYYQGNDRLVSGAKLKIDSISDRITMSFTESTSFFDKIKELKGRQLFYDLHEWLRQNSDTFNYYNESIKSGSNLQSVLTYFANTVNGVHFPFVYGNLYELPFENVPGSVIDVEPKDAFSESELAGLKISYPRLKKEESDTTIDQSKPPIQGSHFFIYAYTFVQFLQSNYGVSLGVGDGFDGNAWEDATFKKIIIPMTGINLMHDGVFSIDSGFYFGLTATNADLSYPLDPLSNVAVNTYSAYDILMSLVRITSATIDADDEGYKFRRLDELEAKGAILNWSGKLDASKQFTLAPKIENYAQKSYIKYEKVDEGISEFSGAKTVVCGNKNLALESELFKVKGFVPKIGVFKNEPAPLMTKAGAYTSPVFLFVQGKMSNSVLVRLHSHGTHGLQVASATVILNKVAVYSLSGEYNFLDKINAAPKLYKADLWLTGNDIRDLDNFTMVYVKELNGMFYVNKISGYNPDKSRAAVSVELIRISDRTPVPPAELPYFLDGKGNVFTDSKGNYYY